MLGPIESSILFAAIMYVSGLVFITFKLIRMPSFNDKINTAKGRGRKRSAMILMTMRIVLWPLYFVLPRQVTNRQYFPFY